MGPTSTNVAVTKKRVGNTVHRSVPCTVQYRCLPRWIKLLAAVGTVRRCKQRVNSPARRPAAGPRNSTQPAGGYFRVTMFKVVCDPSKRQQHSASWHRLTFRLADNDKLTSLDSLWFTSQATLSSPLYLLSSLLDTFVFVDIWVLCMDDTATFCLHWRQMNCFPFTYHPSEIVFSFSTW